MNHFEQDHPDPGKKKPSPGHVICRHHSEERVENCDHLFCAARGELYYGNIDPQNSGFEDDAGVQRELRTISENEDWLTEHLAGEEKKRFLDFADAWSAFNGDATLESFITGFRLGARFVLDAFVLPEASPQNYLQDKE